jgi:SsrA-binding protein
MAQKKSDTERDKVVATNREAYHNYFILETFEAGIQLSRNRGQVDQGGTGDAEGRVCQGRRWRSLADQMFTSAPTLTATARITIRTANAGCYSTKARSCDLFSKIREKGLTLVPTRFYFKGNLIKCEIGLARGKKLYDKRETEARRDQDREARAALKDRNARF